MALVAVLSPVAATARATSSGSVGSKKVRSSRESGAREVRSVESPRKKLRLASKTQ